MLGKLRKAKLTALSFSNAWELLKPSYDHVFVNSAVNQCPEVQTR